MKDLFPVLAAEGLKLKSTLALRLAIWCPTVIVLLVFGIYAGRSEKLGDPDLLTGFAQLTLTIWTIIMFPLYAALIAALVAAVEHQNVGWKHLLALPVDRSTIFVAKWIVAGLQSSLMAGWKPALRKLILISGDQHLLAFQKFLRVVSVVFRDL